MREYVSCASFIFATARSLEPGSEWTILKGFPVKETVREGDRHPGKISADIKADREVRRNAVNKCK